MQDFAEIENENTIIIDGKVNLEDYRIYWFESFTKGLPNTVIFWGILAIGFLFLGILFRDSNFGFALLLLSAFIAVFVIFNIIHGYYSYMQRIKKHISMLSADEKYFNVIIKPGGRGIEYIQGDNFSLISWDKIKGAVEKDKYFSLDYRITPILLMKAEFKDESDIILFRRILTGKFGGKAKLLR